MSLEPDIVAKVRSDFTPEQSDRALELLRSSGVTGRVARCVLLASHGSLDLLIHWIHRADLDERDAILAAEYDQARRQIRDLQVSFLLDHPETFWISGIALMMARRGYALSSLTTRAAAAGPFKYGGDSFEGRAAFVGPEGTIEIEKKDGQWRVYDNALDLQKHNMDRAFSDKKIFEDATSGYLLTRRRTPA